MSDAPPAPLCPDTSSDSLLHKLARLRGAGSKPPRLVRVYLVVVAAVLKRAVDRTENLYGIVGFAKALELATAQHQEDSSSIGAIKLYMMEQLKKHVKGVAFNGDPLGRSLYTVLNVSFPKTERSEMLLFNLDINNICASGGSACTSGAEQGSHVIRAINNNPNQVAVRFSFCKQNTKEEVDAVVGRLGEMI